MSVRYSNVPKGACNMLSMQLADAGLRHAGAAEWFGSDIERSKCCVREAETGQVEDESGRNILREDLPLLLRNQTFEAAESFALVRESLWFDYCGAS